VTELATVCVLGSVNMDLTLRVEELPAPGATVLATSALPAPGGKGANQAVAAARAGASVQFIGAVGSDGAAPMLRSHLADNNIGLDGLVEVDGPSGMATITVEDSGENCIVVAPGANSDFTLDEKLHKDIICSHDVLLCQLEIPVEVALTAARWAAEAGKQFVLNASPVPERSPDLAELAFRASVVVVNQTEAASWLYPSRHLVTTLGDEGSRYRSPQGELTVPSYPVRPLDTTGAGDVFAGVLAAWWPLGAETALRHANVAGALATLRSGAGNCAPSAARIELSLKGS